MIEQVNTFDVNALSALKRAARENTPESIKATAKQFEALFLQMILKSMRDASPKDGMFDSDATRFYQGMSDQQMAGVLAQKGGIGLGAALERQLMLQAFGNTPPAGSTAATTTQAPATPVVPVAAAAISVQQTTANTASAVQASVDASGLNGDPQQFIRALWPQAADAARQLGVPAHFLLAQAALETGWGKAELRGADGSPSYNLFNIKAGKSWKGRVVNAKTTEYDEGVAQTRTESFRAYGSYAEAFQDYARLIQQSPRYAAAQGQADALSFSQALQAGGYATDPAYADKLTRVINSAVMRQGVIATAMSVTSNT
jgi:peptidoglycan hydrolase FlgJ